MMANSYSYLQYRMGIALALLSVVFLWPAIVVATVMMIAILICLIIMGLLYELL